MVDGVFHHLGTWAMFAEGLEVALKRRLGRAAPTKRGWVGSLLLVKMEKVADAQKKTPLKAKRPDLARIKIMSAAAGSLGGWLVQPIGNFAVAPKEKAGGERSKCRSFRVVAHAWKNALEVLFRFRFIKTNAFLSTFKHKMRKRSTPTMQITNTTHQYPWPP